MPILTTTARLPEEPRRGAVWSITEPERELDSNLIRLPAGEEIPAHLGAEVDTLVLIVAGSGTLTTEDGEEPLRTGDIALLLRRTLRGFRAGEEGLVHLTVHRRREALRIGRPPAAG